VLHHRDGGNRFEYRYLGANGPNAGRFPKHPTCFVPNVPRDPIAGPVADDFGFGDELAPLNAKPPHYVRNGLVDAVDWQTLSIDAQGYRLDDTKGLATAFVHDLLESKSMRGKFAVGEYFDGNPDTLNWWVWDSGMQARAATFDFSTRFALQAMCNNAGRWDMGQLDHVGFAGRDPVHAVTFIENHDTDLNSPVISNKVLAYAYILTAEGYPCVYYKDYSADAGCYGLRAPLANLIWIHEHLANGQTAVRWKDFQFIVFERLAWPNLLVGLNNDPSNDWKTVYVQTAFGANVPLHDYSGHAGDLWTDGAGMATIGIPPNHNGSGYVCYSRAHLDAPNAITRLATTQVFEGAADLDIGPAVGGRTTTIGRIWCDAGTDVRLTPDQTTARLSFGLTDPHGTAVTLAAGRGRTHARGWHTVSVDAPGASDIPFRVAVTYTAPQTL
jgi:alpha-amylase